MDESQMASEIAGTVVSDTKFWIAIIGLIGAIVGSALTIIGNLVLRWVREKPGSDLDKKREAYAPYLAEVPKTLEAYGAEILVADFESEGIEVDAKQVTVVLKFSSKEAAKKWYQSPEYQRIIALGQNNSEGISAWANGISS